MSGRCPSSFVRAAKRIAAALAAGLLAVAALAGTAAAQETRFEVGYRATLMGITIGRGALTGRIDGDDYTLDAHGGTAGVAGLFGKYTGEVAAAGRFERDSASPARFEVATRGGDKARSTRLGLSDGTVRDVDIEPEPEPEELEHPARVELTEAHRRGVVDPMSGFVVPGGFDGESFNSAACERVIPIFSGRQRFDVALEFKEVRRATSRSPGSYEGPVLVCAAHYRPIAGHRADREGVRYMAERGDVEVMLAPVADTGLLVPWRVTVRTPYGPGVLQATSMAVDAR